jgi:hypothetical protein
VRLKEHLYRQSELITIVVEMLRLRGRQIKDDALDFGSASRRDASVSGLRRHLPRQDGWVCRGAGYAAFGLS